jgi:hypothetical protein
MTFFKDVIERELANVVKPPIEVIILRGSWNCAKHDLDLIGRCTACCRGVCARCIKSEEEEFCPESYRCAVPYVGKRSPKDVSVINVDSCLNMIDLFSVHTFKSYAIVVKVRRGSGVSQMKGPRRKFKFLILADAQLIRDMAFMKS